MATGIAHRLFMAGITRIVMTEIAHPLAVRRGVAFCEAVYEGFMEVEGVRAERISDGAALDLLWKRGLCWRDSRSVMETSSER